MANHRCVGPVIASPGTLDAGVTYHFEITDNKVLKLYPVLPDCAKQGCFAAHWAVNVSTTAWTASADRRS